MLRLILLLIAIAFIDPDVVELAPEDYFEA